MTDEKKPEISEMRPKITIVGVGGGGGNAVNNMITQNLQGVDFIAANTDAQALTMSKAERLIQLGANSTEGLGAGSLPEIGQAAAEETIDEIMDHLSGTHMCFVTAGMGGGTGTGAAPIIAAAARNAGILTVAVVTKPFTFEGNRRMAIAERGIEPSRITSIPNACDLELFHPQRQGEAKQPELIAGLPQPLAPGSFLAAFTGAHGPGARARGGRGPLAMFRAGLGRKPEPGRKSSGSCPEFDRNSAIGRKPNGNLEIRRDRTGAAGGYGTCELPKNRAFGPNPGSTGGLCFCCL